MKFDFEVPAQVAFVPALDAENENPEVLYGIGVGDKIICACCGGTFDYEEVSTFEIFDFWVDFSTEISK